jgi:hypothetical protein
VAFGQTIKNYRKRHADRHLVAREELAPRE